MALAAAIGVASVTPLARAIRLLRLAAAGVGHGVRSPRRGDPALFGVAADSAVTTEKLIAASIGEDGRGRALAHQAVFGRSGRRTQLDRAHEASSRRAMRADRRTCLATAGAHFWTPPQQTSESALLTRWNGSSTR
jgi:cytochrome c-type biogenesis protein CcmF